MTVRIAIVDDDESILDSAKMVLESYGWQARTYASGEAFIADLARGEVDCIVLDPHLPGISGNDVACLVRERYPQISIIGLTARPYDARAINLATAGARIVLTKPVSAATLIETIERATRNRDRNTTPP